MPLLNEEERTKLFTHFQREFPTFTVELCYDVDDERHNKEEQETFFYAILPIGLKAVLWCTIWHNRAVVLIYPIRNKEIDFQNMLLYQQEEKPEFCKEKGTVFFGTLFHMQQSNPYFSCENVFYASHKHVYQETFYNKLVLYQTLFPLLKQCHNINIALPVMYTTFEEAFRKHTELPYGVYGIQLRNLTAVNVSALLLAKNAFQLKRKKPEYVSKAAVLHKTPVYGFALPPTKRVRTTTKITDAIFVVQATLQADMYDLFCTEVTNATGGTLIKYGTAMIPSYKRSVCLNKLFRHIRENDNLDYLEESDTEEDFEDRNENKFVDLQKKLPMRCVYLPKFRKWEPQAVIETKHYDIITYADAQRLGPF